MLWSAYHCVHGTSCLCTSSASAFIEPSLYRLDFLLEIFLWRLQLLLHRSICLLLLFFLSKNLYYITILHVIFTITITYYYYPKSAVQVDEPLASDEQTSHEPSSGNPNKVSSLVYKLYWSHACTSICWSHSTNWCLKKIQYSYYESLSSIPHIYYWMTMFDWHA